MKSILIIFALIASVYGDHDAWGRYKRHHHRKYHHDNKHHEDKHYKNFKHHHHKIVEHNSQSDISYTMDHNEFSVLSDEEFSQMYLREVNIVPKKIVQGAQQGGLSPASYAKGPDSMSYAKYCLPVRHQGTCGSCWAFATSAQVETVLKRRNYAYNTFLSPQYLVDCAPNIGCVGGGVPSNAFIYMKNNGLVQEPNYPYTAVKNVCQKDTPKYREKIESYTHYDLNRNEQQLANILYEEGPVVVSIFSSISFRFYSSGIYLNETCPNTCKLANHAVLLVGYGVEVSKYQTIKYWLVKNSWGISWGENGYVRMIRGSDEYNNNCNIACGISFSN